jgi:ribonuclease VapC
MIIDTSALLAVLLQESDAEKFSAAIAGAPRRLVSTVSFLETSIVIQARKGPPGGRELDLLLHRAGIEVVPFTAEQADVARQAWLQFGKGRHRASFNLGDCCSYALSRISGEALLFKGGDLSLSDVQNATECTE